MSTRNRTVTVITGAAVATALAGAAAFAAVPSAADTDPMSGVSAHSGHMEGLDGDEITEMQQLMTDGASVGEMHRWMIDKGIDLGQMHGEMARSGMNPGQMHRTMATTGR